MGDQTTIAGEEMPAGKFVRAFGWLARSANLCVVGVQREAALVEIHLRAGRPNHALRTNAFLLNGPVVARFAIVTVPPLLAVALLSLG